MADLNFVPRLVVTDIDGVWTDGGMYYDEQGNEWKKFHTYDSAGVIFLRRVGIPLAICTGEESKAVRRRAEKLKIEYVFDGVSDKVRVISELCERLRVQLAEVAYLGDDLNDLALFEKVGLSACPASAPVYVQRRVRLVLKKKGGEGAFREFVETILGDKIDEVAGRPAPIAEPIP